MLIHVTLNYNKGKKRKPRLDNPLVRWTLTLPRYFPIAKHLAEYLGATTKTDVGYIIHYFNNLKGLALKSKTFSIDPKA